MPMPSTIPATPGRVSCAPVSAKQRHDDHNIDRQRDIGHQTAETIAEQHEQHNQNDADHACLNGAIERLNAQRRGDGAHFEGRQVQRQCAGKDQRRQVLRLVRGEVAGDFTLAARNHGIDRRAGNGLPVQRDGNGLAQIGCRGFGEKSSRPRRSVQRQCRACHPDPEPPARS